jgi:hypothetical protein
LRFIGCHNNEFDVSVPSEKCLWGSNESTPEKGYSSMILKTATRSKVHGMS